MENGYNELAKQDYLNLIKQKSGFKNHSLTNKQLLNTKEVISVFNVQLGVFLRRYFSESNYPAPVHNFHNWVNRINFKPSFSEIWAVWKFMMIVLK